MRNIAGLLDEGARLCDVQPPARCEASWELVAVDGDGQPVGGLSSLHELLGDV